MARQRQISARPMIVGAARRAIRGGASREDAISQVGSNFPDATTREIVSAVNREQTRFQSAQQLAELDKRRNVDLSEIAGCKPGSPKVIVSVSVPVTNQQTGETQRYTANVPVDSKGKLSDLLSTAVQAVQDEAKRKGYDPRATRGVGSYRANIAEVLYVEC